MSDQIVVRDPLNRLNERERTAYERHMKAKEPPLPHSVQTRFFASYMDGHSLEEIQRLNHTFKLGPVVRAAVEGEWDRVRRDYLNTLFLTAAENAGQRQVESVGFLGDLLAVAHKQHGQKLRQYLETGDERYLKDAITIQGIESYRKVAESFLKMSGQDIPKPQLPEEPPARDPGRAKEVQARVENAIPGELADAGKGRPMLASEAASLLEAVVVGDKGK